jgi:alkylation response protein AidB-like acyl-CoA dehydrogenase
VPAVFSEPVAGSDLAGLRTKAEKDGDHWVINGQKIWTSGAHYSDHGMILTRTDPNVAKHDGLTMFFFDMKSPGVEVRPIKQVNGQSGFNEVFFTDLRIPDHQRLGAVGQGWKVSLTTLMNERMSIGAGMPTGFPEMLDFCCEFETGDGLAVDDPAVRSKLAQWAVRTSGLKYTAWRSISALSRGQIPGPENSIGKLVAGTTLQEIAAFAMDLQGPSGVLVDACAAHRGGALPGDAAALAGHPHRRRHRRDPAQHHRRAGAGAAGGYAGRPGDAVQPDPDAGTLTGRALLRCALQVLLPVRCTPPGLAPAGDQLSAAPESWTKRRSFLTFRHHPNAVHHRGGRLACPARTEPAGSAAAHSTAVPPRSGL